MAEVIVKYKGSAIAELNESGSKTLETKGKYCESDIVVDYTRPDVGEGGNTGGEEVVQANYKQFSFTNASAVAAKYTTIVSGDSDVAEHYADSTALVTIRKIKETRENGLTFIMSGNMAVMGKYGTYGNYTASSSASSAGPINHPLSAVEGVSSTEVHVIATASGDIKVFCMRAQNNFGGAEYDIRFSW